MSVFQSLCAHNNSSWSDMLPTAQTGSGIWLKAAGRFSPQPSILGGGSSRDDFGDEDAGVVAHVGVVSSSRYAEAKA